MSAGACEHVARIDRLVPMSDAAYRRHDDMGTLSAAILGREAIAACRAECGERSPYWGHVSPLDEIAIEPVDLRMPSALELLMEPFGEALTWVVAWWRRRARP